MTNRMQSSNDLSWSLTLHEKILKKKVIYPRPPKISSIRQACWLTSLSTTIWETKA